MKRYILWILLLKLTTIYGYPQINISCSAATEVGYDEEEWPPESVVPPSVLKELTVTLADMHEEHSAVALNISWAINIDYSNKYLTGTEISVGKKYFHCHYYPRFNEVNTIGHEQLWFHYTEIPAEPATFYEVTGINLPKSEDGIGITSKSELFQTPDCSNGRMRRHESCLYMEWNPNITSNFVNGQVEVSFTSSKYSTKYDLGLWRCALQKECLISGEFISKDRSFTKGESRWTITLNSTGPCDSLHIVIMPHFSKCSDKHCDSNITRVDCSQREPKNLTFLLCLAGIMMLLVSAAVLIWYKAYKTYSDFGRTLGTPLLSVLVVYPAGNRAFQRAVVAFAEFLQSHWHCKVSVDVWQRGKIAEQGPLRWLITQTEGSDKVVILCTQRTEAWERRAGHYQLGVLRDHTVPASAQDVFSLALNMIEGQLQYPSALRKYCTVYLGDRPDWKCLPSALRVCKSFSVMKDVEKLGRHLHNSSREACCFPSIGLKPGSLNGEAAGRLRDAIRELQSSVTLSR